MADTDAPPPRIKKEAGLPKAKRSVYFGYTAESEFLSWSWKTLQEYLIGQLILSIGKGTFQDEVRVCFSMAAAWSLRHDEKEEW